MKKTLFFLAIVTLFSCNQLTSNDQTVIIEKKYSISLPSFLEKATSLNEAASLQYQNARKEFYVIVIDEAKSALQKALDDNSLNDVYSNDIKGYSDLILNDLEKSVKISNKTEITDTIINDMPARLLTITGEVEGVNIFYSLAFIEGVERYYQILAWTLDKKENEYKEKMSRILYSLKEIQSSKNRGQDFVPNHKDTVKND